jgi:hypothetical protein
VGFRNEFSLRRRGAKMSAIPVFVFGHPPAGASPVADLEVAEAPQDPAIIDILRRLRRRMRVFQSGGAAKP